MSTFLRMLWSGRTRRREPSASVQERVAAYTLRAPRSIDVAPIKCPVSNDVDTRFYPASETVDWEPLRKHLCSGWMFMQVDGRGSRYYKNKATREYLTLDEDGDIVDRGFLASDALRDAYWDLRTAPINPPIDKEKRSV